jgi:phosphatidylglycerophosphatase A
MPWYVYVAELGFLGKLPLAPGTWGSAAAALLYAVLFYAGIEPWFLAILTILLVAASIPLCNWASLYMGQQDPANVVLDELVGQWITLYPYFWLPLWTENSYNVYAGFLAGFLLFHFFDVLNIFPINRIENLEGGWGIVLDDCMAGLYAQGVLYLLASYLS